MQFHSSYKSAETSELNFFHGAWAERERQRQTDRQIDTETDTQRERTGLLWDISKIVVDSLAIHQFYWSPTL